MTVANKFTYDPYKHMWESSKIQITIEPKAFDNGSLRRAHRMKIDSEDKYVAKFPISGGRHKTSNCTDDVVTQAIASRWADKYNKENVPSTIKFIEAFIVTYEENGKVKSCCCEEYMSGDFKKFNNNDDYHDNNRCTPDAFSHYTWEKSKHTILVCDIQGVGNLWTDPQILTINGNDFSLGNTGRTGIRRFLSTHICNPICKSLNLPATSRRATSPIAQKSTVLQKPHVVWGMRIYKKDGKFYLSDIKENSLAHERGLRDGHVIELVNDVAITSDYSMGDIKKLFINKDLRVQCSF
jgi:hypothetical protein